MEDYSLQMSKKKSKGNQSAASINDFRNMISDKLQQTLV